MPRAPIRDRIMLQTGQEHMALPNEDSQRDGLPTVPHT